MGVKQKREAKDTRKKSFHCKNSQAAELRGCADFLEVFKTQLDKALGNLV